MKYFIALNQKASNFVIFSVSTNHVFGNIIGMDYALTNIYGTETVYSVVLVSVSAVCVTIDKISFVGLAWQKFNRTAVLQ